MDENNNITPNENDALSTADVYEKANEAATKPAVSEPAEEKTPETTYYSASETTEEKPATTTNTYTSSYDYSNTATVTTEEPSTGFAIASLILGILSLLTSCCCGLGTLFSILGIIFGCIQQKNSEGKKPGTAIAGIITSAIGILFSIIAIIYFIAIGAAAEL